MFHCAIHPATNLANDHIHPHLGMFLDPFLVSHWGQQNPGAALFRLHGGVPSMIHFGWNTSWDNHRTCHGGWPDGTAGFFFWHNKVRRCRGFLKMGFPLNHPCIDGLWWIVHYYRWIVRYKPARLGYQWALWHETPPRPASRTKASLAAPVKPGGWTGEIVVVWVENKRKKWNIWE